MGIYDTKGNGRKGERGWRKGVATGGEKTEKEENTRNTLVTETSMW